MARSNRVDEEIIQYLKNNSRKSYADIGRELGLSEATIRRRVKNLMDERIIKRFTIEMGEEEATSAIVFISVDSSTDTPEISEMLVDLKGVKKVYEITGQYDIATIMSATSITGINSSIDELRKIPGVIDTNTVIILKKIV